MNKIKQMFNRNLGIILLVVVLSLALAGQAAAAEKKWTFHEDKWPGMLAYGSIPIDKDMPTEWGPWTAFVQPAAGLIPVAVLPTMKADGTDYFRPESAKEYSPRYKLEMPELDFCKGGEWCGYALYKNYSKTGGDSVRAEQYNGGYYNKGYSAGRIALTLTPNEMQDGDGYYCKVPGVASWRAIGLFGAPNPTFTESGEMAAYFSKFKIPAYFDAETEDPYLPHESGYDKAYADGSRFDSFWWNLVWGYPDEMTTGSFGRNAELWGEPYIKKGVNGVYIAGLPTSLTDMSSLRANNLKATYWGSTYLAKTIVKINVQFGPGTWDGKWNWGKDIGDKMGFTAAGKIKGADFYSTKVGADDDPNKYTVKVSGNVLGTFYGKGEDAAKALAGAVDITKTKLPIIHDTEPTVSNSIGYQDKNYVDLFKAVQVPEKEASPAD